MGSEFPTKLSPSFEDETPPGADGRQESVRAADSRCSMCHLPVVSTYEGSLSVGSACTCCTPPIASTSAIQHPSPLARRHKKKASEKAGGSGHSKRQLFKEEIASTSSQITPQVTLSTIPVESHPQSILDQPGTSQLPLIDDRPSTSSAALSELPLSNVCSICLKSFTSPGKLAQHMYAHSGEKPFVCDHCFKAFSSKFKLVRHVLIHSDLRQYHCSHCERTFHRKDHLKNHAKIHSPVKRRLKCDREGCGKEYSSPLSFKKHTAVHAAEEGNLECKICSQVFSTKEEIVFHLKVHAGSRSAKTPADRKYQCSYCERSFFTAKDVRRHLVVHTGKRDFLCQFCPQRFGRKDHLTRHIRKSHCNSSKSKKHRRGDRDRHKPADSILESFSASRAQKLPSSFSQPTASASNQSHAFLETESLKSPIPSTRTLASSLEQSKSMLGTFPSSQVPTSAYESIPSSSEMILKSETEFIDINLDPELSSAESSRVPPTSAESLAMEENSSLYSSVEPLWHKPQGHYSSENILNQPSSSTMLPDLVYNPHASAYPASYDENSTKIEPLSPYSSSFEAVSTKHEPSSPYSPFESSDIKMDPEFSSNSNLAHFMDLIPPENIHELEAYQSQQQHHHHQHPQQHYDPSSIEMSTSVPSGEQQFSEEATTLPRDLLQYPLNTELINTLLQTNLQDDSSATLPTFNQAFQQQQQQPPS
nr:PREDICTED: zinc finger protein PLAG1-like [Bemisia tabaci]